MGWGYRLANKIHIETRDDFLAGELLFQEGDCLDQLLLDESGRILREHDFIARADVFAVRQPDGQQHVVVDTWDEWTTQVSLQVSLGEGFELRGLRLKEKNFLGRGILVGAFFRERKERRDLGMEYLNPRLFSTRVDALLAAGNTRVGNFVTQELSYPFVGEVGRGAARQVFRHRNDQFSYSLPAENEFSNAVIPLLTDYAELTGAVRLGRPGNLTVFGAGISRESLDFPELGGALELIRDGDFGNPVPGGDTELGIVASQTRHRATTRVNFILGQRSVHFVQRRGLDALDGVQDIRVGVDVGLVLGRSIGGTGADESPDEDDLFTAFNLFVGFAPGPYVVNAGLRVEGRRVFEGTGLADWRDVLGEADLYAYWQPPARPDHTFFARISASGGWAMESPFQLTLGGVESLRGLSEEAYPGARRIIFSVEDRLRLHWPSPEALDFGLTFFGDAGTMWGGDVPFGADSGLQFTLGSGIRIGFPAGSAGVLRIDLAVPISAANGVGGLRLRVNMDETLGLLLGFGDRQMRRSRRGDFSRPLGS